MPRGGARPNSGIKPVDLDALHRVLWRRTNRKGILLYRSADLQALMGIGDDMVGIYLTELERRGSIKRLRVGNGSRPGRIRVFSPYAQNRRGSPAVPVRMREAGSHQAKGDGIAPEGDAASEATRLAG